MSRASHLGFFFTHLVSRIAPRPILRDFQSGAPARTRQRGDTARVETFAAAALSWLMAACAFAARPPDVQPIFHPDSHDATSLLAFDIGPLRRGER